MENWRIDDKALTYAEGMKYVDEQHWREEVANETTSKTLIVIAKEWNRFFELPSI